MQPVTLIAHPLPRNTDVVAVSWNTTSNLPAAHAWVNFPAITEMDIHPKSDTSDEPDDLALADFQASHLGCRGCPLQDNEEYEIDINEHESLRDEICSNVEYGSAYVTAILKLPSLCEGANYSDDFCRRYGCEVYETEYYTERFNHYDTQDDPSDTSIDSPSLYVTCEIHPNGDAQYARHGANQDDRHLLPMLAIQAAFCDESGIVHTSGAWRGVNMFSASEPPYVICWGDTPEDSRTSLRDAHAAYLATPGNEDLLSSDRATDNTQAAFAWLEATNDPDSVIAANPLPASFHVVHAIDDTRQDYPAALLLATSLHHPAAFARLVASGAKPLPGGNHAYVALPLFEHTITTEDRTAQGLRTSPLSNSKCWFILPQPASNDGWLGQAIGQLDASNGYAPCG